MLTLLQSVATFARSQFGPYVLALAAGALMVLGFAPYNLFFIPWLSLVAIFWLWHHASTPAQAFKLGMAFGLGLYGLGIYWIYICLHTFGGMPWWFAGFATFCLCAFMALFVGLVGWGAKKIGHVGISGAVLWALSDWVRSWIFTGFPWLTLGYSQVPHSPLAGYLPLVGAYGVSLMTALLAFQFGVLIFTALSPVEKRNRIAVVSVVLVAGLFLKAVEWSAPVGKPISVALLQGNISQLVKWSPEHTQSTLMQYLNMVKQTNAQLTVLPETALPMLSDQIDPAYLDALKQHAVSQGGDLLVGVVQANIQTGEYFNSAMSLGVSPTQAYSKSHLVPFGEFIPFKSLIGWIYRDWLNMPLSDLSRGTSHAPLLLAGQKVGVNICYEDVFGEEIIHQLPQAELLVNITNDAWYGQSFAASQHMQFSQARAIETARMVLRATNTGATAIIDSHGYVLAEAPHDAVNIVVGQAQSYQGVTPYVRWGNWPFILLSFAILGLLWRQRALPKKR